MFRSTTAALSIALAAAMASPTHATEPVTIERDNGSIALMRDGKSFRFKGAGGSGDYELLAQAGGNAIRTWGIGPETRQVLDDAHENGLVVVFGIWLRHERKGFDYNDAEAVAAQLEEARDIVETWKDHPAIVAWSIGNEMEGYEDANNAAVWSHVQSIAGIVKDIDPDRPTMTVTAEVGGGRVPNIHRLCPDIDIVGINSYGGASSLPERYPALVPDGYEPKPYVVTEYGPAGTWEVPMNAFDVPEEQTSTQKAAVYKSVYETLEADKDLCLGSFAFTWGSKREATSTWFGLFTSTGEKVSGVDALADAWGGSVDNRAPNMEPLSVDRQSAEGGTKLSVTTSVTDPENDSLETEWVLSAEQPTYFTGGDTQAETPSYPEAITDQRVDGCTITLPEQPGIYRLYAVVRDGNGSAATASLPLRVEGKAGDMERAVEGAAKVTLPLVLVGDEAKQAYIPSGYIGDHASIKYDPADATDPQAGKTASRLDFNASAGWGGIVWQSPPNDWGDVDGGYDLSNAKRLRFWARGAEGGENISFGFGGIGRDKPFFDTADVIMPFTLTKQWKQYEIDLAGQDMSRIKSGFRWTGAADGKPFAFYLDEVRYE